MGKISIPANMMMQEKLLEAKTLLEEVKQLERFLDKDIIEFLKASINLDVSILTYESINIVLGELKVFRQIAIYNIINRTQKTVNNISDIDIGKLHALVGKEYLTINYLVDDKDYFTIFNSSLGDTRGLGGSKNDPFIHVFETNKNRTIERMENELLHTSIPSGCVDDILVGHDENGNSIFKPVYGGPNSRKAFEAKNKIESLKLGIKQLEKIGTERDRITKIVTDTLLDDWNMELEKEEVKSLKWVKVKKTSNIR